MEHSNKRTLSIFSIAFYCTAQSWTAPKNKSLTETGNLLLNSLSQTADFRVQVLVPAKEKQTSAFRSIKFLRCPCSSNWKL